VTVARIVTLPTGVTSRCDVGSLLAQPQPRSAMHKLNAVDRHMEKNRLEALSDGVLAIVIPIMVLELQVRQGTSPGALQ
jgi:hypothetical protein